MGELNIRARSKGIIMLLSCSYFMLVTPFRFAGFLYGHANMVILLDTLDALAASTMAIDMVINFIQTKLRIGNITQILEAEENMELDMLRRRFRREFPNDDLPSVAVLKQFYKANRPGLFKSFRKSVLMFYYRRRVAIYGALQSLRMDRWVPWPALDARVLISFPLQWMYMPTSICAQVGLHWTQLFGMIRFLTVTRVWHAMLCAENNALIEQQLDANRQVQIRVTKLLLALALIIHISACTWCTIARLRLGVEAEGFEPTTFFPSTDILYGEGSNVLRSYSRAVHWAFVNLSGIGDVDSTPETALECFTILMVHIMGAIFFAIVTGNVIAMLEEKTQSENKIGSDIVKLSSYLENVRVSEFSKDRIMKGYMMRNVLTQGGETTAAASEGPDANDEILKTLPKYLRHEVAIYARAELIHRKDIFFSHCSKGFLVALSSGLPNVRTLLSGDYLMKEGQLYRDQFVLVESGQLQVREEGHTIKILGRGDCIGKAWLLQLKHEAKHEKLVEKTDWVKNDGTAVLSIRALSPCTLFTGLYTDADIRKLKRGYKIDFQLLQAGVHGNRKSESEKKAIARKVLAKAAQRYINRKRSKAEQVKKWQISGRKVITANAFIHETGRAVENRKEKEPDCMGCMLM